MATLSLRFSSVVISLSFACASGGEDLSISRVTPRVFCTAAPVSIRVEGTGFPAPGSGAEPPSLPRIELLSYTLFRAVERIDVPADSTHVQLESSTAFALQITPDLGATVFNPYSLVVKRGDGAVADLGGN